MFEWAAPLFGRFAHRWATVGLETMEDWLNPVARRGEILDVGGGTGALAQILADRVGARVTILDLAPKMLAHVPERADLIPVLGSAADMPFADAGFDAVVSTDAIHHFGDRPAALAEMVRVLRPGGRIAVVEIERGGIVHGLALLERLVGEPAGFYLPVELQSAFAQAGAVGGTESLRGPLFMYRGKRPD